MIDFEYPFKSSDKKDIIVECEDCGTTILINQNYIRICNQCFKKYVIKT